MDYPDLQGSLRREQEIIRSYLVPRQRMGLPGQCRGTCIMFFGSRTYPTRDPEPGMMQRWQEPFLAAVLGSFSLLAPSGEQQEGDALQPPLVTGRRPSEEPRMAGKPRRRARVEVFGRKQLQERRVSDGTLFDDN